MNDKNGLSCSPERLFYIRPKTSRPVSIPVIHAISKIKKQASDTWETADCGILPVFDRFAVIDRNHTQPVRYKKYCRM